MTKEEMALEIIRLRKENIGVRTIANRLGVTKETVRYHCKKHGLSGFIARPENQTIIDRMKEIDIGFEYVRGYDNSEGNCWIRCKKCNAEIERSCITLRHVLSGSKNLNCPNCLEHQKALKEKALALDKLRKQIIKYSQTIPRALKEVYISSCKCCGIYFGHEKKQTFCSDNCKKKYNNRQSDIRKRLRNKKIKENGMFDKTITLEKLFIKDKGKCYICHSDCSFQDFTLDTNNNFIIGKTYPTIEHCYPISKGGTHTWDNIKLACWECNTKKSISLIDKSKEQMSLYI